MVIISTRSRTGGARGWERGGVTILCVRSVVWEDVKRAEGEATSPLCDTPTERSDEGRRASSRVFCDYVCIKTASRANFT